MIELLIPIGGGSGFLAESHPYPKPLIEINGKLLIERVLEGLNTLGEEIRFNFVIGKVEAEKFRLDKTLKLLTNSNSFIHILEGETEGATCSALLCAGKIREDSEVIVVNSDNIFTLDLSKYLNEFRNDNVDAAVLSFNSVHPRWSYVLVDNNDFILETREKDPISRAAIAGFYYYKNFSDFVSSAEATIRKDFRVDGKFYLSSTLNELILKGKKIKSYQIPDKKNFIIYSEEKLKEYEIYIRSEEVK